MAGLPVNVNGSWKDGKPYVNVNGSWKEVQYAYANVDGSWKQVFANFNKATGGKVTDVDNYRGTGQKWRIHEFTSNQTLSVETAAYPFKVLIVAGGGGGGYCGQYSVWSNYGSGGGAGGFYEGELTIPEGDYAVSIGAGGSAGTVNRSGGHGGASAIASILTVPGGGGGRSATNWASDNGPPANGLSGGSGGGARGGAGSGGVASGGAAVDGGKWGHPGGSQNGLGAGSGGGAGGPGRSLSQGVGPGRVSYITNKARTFGEGGRYYGSDPATKPANSGYGGDAGHGISSSRNGGPGASGIVIVAYQIG